MEACKGGGGLRSNVHVAETARQIYKMHKNPTKQTLCVDLRCMEKQQIFGLLTMNQPQLA